MTREVTKAGRREHARQLFVGPVEPVVPLVEKLPQPEVESRSRGRQASRQGASASRQTGRRAPAPRRGEETYFEREEEEELVRRNEVVASVPKRRKEIKLTGQRAMKKKKKAYSKHASKRGRVANIHSYRVTNEDGSITWGYENADGSFKEETIGVDCVTHGKYGYIDPNGEVRVIILFEMDLFSELRKLTKGS